jgi:hypothetical protein
MFPPGSHSFTTLRAGAPAPPPADDPLEVGVPARIAMDRHVLRHIKFQPLDVLEERNGIRADIGRSRRALRRWRVEVGVDQDLLLREIGDQHVVAVVEAIDVIKLDRLIPVAGCVLIS